MTELFDYYIERDESPTYAGLATESAFVAYDRLRRTIFHRLQLPPSVFEGRRLLEFGPDTGENALVFARWGARVTLVEPNVKAHVTIRNYFKRFELESRLEGLERASLLDYAPPDRVDVVDAEGFIYSVQPPAAWMRKCADCLVPGGLLIISYMERYGGFIELLLKAIYRRVIEDRAWPAGVDTIRRLYLPKWNSIPHTRTIESWFMDVIENPFVRLKYFLDAGCLVSDMQSAGFRLHSSWPTYRDPMEMHWIKARRPDGADARASVSFIERRRLSHVLGLRAPETSASAATALAAAVEIVDRLCDAPSRESCAEAQSLLDAVECEVDGSHAGVPVLRMCQSLFRLMSAEPVDALIEFCRTDPVFIGAWGSPAHYAVYRYDPEFQG